MIEHRTNSSAYACQCKAYFGLIKQKRGKCRGQGQEQVAAISRKARAER